MWCWVEERQTLYHYASPATHGGGGSVAEAHQDTEGEALSHATLLQLVHQGSLAVRLENMPHHPTTGNGIPMERQAVFVIALECKRVFEVVHHDRL